MCCVRVEPDGTVNTERREVLKSRTALTLYQGGSFLLYHSRDFSHGLLTFLLFLISFNLLLNVAAVSFSQPFELFLSV